MGNKDIDDFRYGRNEMKKNRRRCFIKGLFIGFVLGIICIAFIKIGCIGGGPGDGGTGPEPPGPIGPVDPPITPSDQDVLCIEYININKPGPISFSANITIGSHSYPVVGKNTESFNENLVNKLYEAHKTTPKIKSYRIENLEGNIQQRKFVESKIMEIWNLDPKNQAR